MAYADSFSVHEVVTHQSPLTTKPVRTSEDISYSGNSQRDDSNNIGNDEVSHSASRDFAETLKEIKVITYGHINNQQTGPVVTGLTLQDSSNSATKPLQTMNLPIATMTSLQVNHFNLMRCG
jgi:hypothetical protein